MKNVIAFKKGFINLPTKLSYNRNESMAMSVQAELMRFGYIMDDSAMKMLSFASPDNIEIFYNEVIYYLKEITGGLHDYKPFYEGFPTQVMELSESEMWLDALKNYWLGGSFKSVGWAGTKSTAFEHTTYKIITSGNNEKFENIFTNLLSGNQSLTPDDLKTVDWFVNNYDVLKFPATVPFKETMCTVLGGLIGKEDVSIKLPNLTATDILRICIYLSDGDISLPKVPNKLVRTNAWSRTLSVNLERDNFKFKKFTNKERKFILNLIEESNCDIRDMKLKLNRWIRLGEILHPMSYKNKFPKTFDLFYKLRNEKVVSWHGEVDSAFKISFEEGLKKLSERSGEYMRKLDYLVRNSDTYKLELVLSKFGGNAFNGSSNKVLYETYSHFENRNTAVMDRSIFIKGARKKTVLPSLPAIDQEIINLIQDNVLSALKNKFSKLDSLGKVWIDPELIKVPLPSNMRSLNDSQTPTVRGTRIPLGLVDPKVIRAFVHWYDARGNEDLDLSAIFLGEKGNIERIGWNGDKNTAHGLYSGDVRHKLGACAEYIDINVKNSLDTNFKYVILTVNNYTGRGFDTVKDCVTGFEKRDYPEANTNWKPASIVNSLTLKTPCPNTLISIIDIETMEYIFLDLDVNGIPVASNNIGEILNAINPYLNNPKFSVYDLLHLHAEARGQMVDTKEEADIVFNFSDFSTSYVETMKYMGV